MPKANQTVVVNYPHFEQPFFSADDNIDILTSRGFEGELEDLILKFKCNITENHELINFIEGCLKAYQALRK